MSKLRTIKKYSNRRLYDLQVRRYVTLEEIYGWVGDGIDVRVIDKDRQEDITCAVLFQVVAAHEHRVCPSMSADFLRQAIRVGAGGSSGMMSLFLELSLKLFLSDEMRDRVRAGAGEEPSQVAERLASEGYERWCLVRSEICRMLAEAGCDDSATEAQGAWPTGPVVLDGLDRGPRRSARQPAGTAMRK